jgi:hypothetical protein
MPLPNRAERRKRISNYRKPGKLDAYNEALAQRGLHLHPTKGYRKFPYRRVVAAHIVDEMKQGRGSIYAIWQAAQAYKRARARALLEKVSPANSEAPEGPQVLQEEE